MYDIHLSRVAGNDLKSLPQELRVRMLPHIKSLGAEPRPRGSRKLQGSKNDWRLRVGNYRVIYEIDDDQKRVNVMRVKHRREAYR